MKLWQSLILFLFFPVDLPAQSAISAAGPEHFQLVTTDVEHFWQAYELSYPWFFPEIFDSLYLQRASSGLRTYQRIQMTSIDSFCRMVREEWDYYELLKIPSLHIWQYEQEVRAAAFALKYLYPEAHFPDIYFVMGKRAAGDLAFNQGIIINAGQFGPYPATPTRARRTIAAGYAVELIPAYIARKLVLHQQHYPEPLTLLGHCIREGVAELITELITGHRLHARLNTYTSGKERGIWRAFLSSKDDQITGNWLSATSTDQASGRLGIWIGYQIARAYYDQAMDKRAAIAEMLQIQDFDCFLEKSKVLEKQ